MKNSKWYTALVLGLAIPFVVGSTIELLKERGFYVTLPSNLQWIAQQFSLYANIIDWGAVGWLFLGVTGILLWQSQRPKLQRSEHIRLFAFIDRFSNKVLFAKDQEIQAFCVNLAGDESVLWLDKELASLRTRFLKITNFHFGLKEDRTLLRGASEGRRLVIVETASAELVVAKHGREPSARQNFEELLEAMKSRISDLALLDENVQKTLLK